MPPAGSQTTAWLSPLVKQLKMSPVDPATTLLLLISPTPVSGAGSNSTAPSGQRMNPEDAITPLSLMSPARLMGVFPVSSVQRNGAEDPMGSDEAEPLAWFRLFTPSTAENAPTIQGSGRTFMGILQWCRQVEAPRHLPDMGNPP